MKNKKQPNHINIETLAGGAFTEKLNEALLEVAKNIQDPNTEATAKRGITVTIKFAPQKNRSVVNTSIAVTTKLAASEEIDTQMMMGVNVKTGAVEVAECYSGQIAGQMSLMDTEDADDDQHMDDGGAPEPEQEAAAIGRPLDLRNRHQKAEPVPGNDFDEETGEVYETNPEEIVSKLKTAMKA